MHGNVFNPDQVSVVVKACIEKSGVEKKGASHLFRHTMASLLLENGADLRFIQVILGHASLKTTEIYTHVTIRKLKEIHSALHPPEREPERKEVPED